MQAILFLLTSSIAGQTGVEAQRSAVEAMEKSIARQRQSVQRQVAGSTAQPDAGDGFFTFSWAKLMADNPESFADCNQLTQAEIGRLVAENARREGLQPDVLREVMRRESAFWPCAVSKKGAQGLMQLMPATAEDFGVTDPFDPDQNVAAGAKFLRKLLDRYSGDLALALSAYNAGPGRVDDANGIPNIAETRNYVGAILRAVLLE